MVREEGGGEEIQRTPVCLQSLFFEKIAKTKCCAIIDIPGKRSHPFFRGDDKSTVKESLIFGLKLEI